MYRDAARRRGDDLCLNPRPASELAGRAVGAAVTTVGFAITAANAGSGTAMSARRRTSRVRRSAGSRVRRQECDAHVTTHREPRERREHIPFNTFPWTTTDADIAPAPMPLRHGGPRDLLQLPDASPTSHRSGSTTCRSTLGNHNGTAHVPDSRCRKGIGLALLLACGVATAGTRLDDSLSHASTSSSRRNGAPFGRRTRHQERMAVVARGARHRHSAEHGRVDRKNAEIDISSAGDLGLRCPTQCG